MWGFAYDSHTHTHTHTLCPFLVNSGESERAATKKATSLPRMIFSLTTSIVCYQPVCMAFVAEVAAAAASHRCSGGVGSSTHDCITTTTTTTTFALLHLHQSCAFYCSSNREYSTNRCVCIGEDFFYIHPALNHQHTHT